MTVVLIDALRFRRIAYTSSLKGWADANDVELVSAGPEDPQPADRARMIIVIAGSTPVAAALNMPFLAEMKIAPVAPRVVVMSEVEASTEAAAALRAGAHGFIPLTLEAPVVFQALSYILAGGTYYPPTMLLRHEQGPGADTSTRSSLNKMRNFTSLEWLILEKLSQAKSNKAIAADLNICEATIKMHIRRIMQKLGVANRTQIALYCANWRRDRDASLECADRAR